ncbi:MAG: pyruvate, phosphate dikinase [Betaproteobacteria bacterium RIFCSPHIGHO2_12_FULL_69_13]|nr:MAG: pyruvate, phosphate dikinase [Betaproteobacteria bacterium RIFCSPHIGHO2_12_FULL_69_13]
MAKKPKKPKSKPAKAPAGKFVYFFGGGKADGRGDMKELLGGKGAGLAEMTNAQLPVPPGFTLATSACRHFFENGNRLGPAIERQVERAVKCLEAASGHELGSQTNPLLVSVRSGAKFSMPGMMDTILNLGLNDDTVQALERRSRNPRFAQDCYRRFIQMFGNIVLGIKKEEFDHLFEGVKKETGARVDTDLTGGALTEVVRRYKKLVQERTGKPFPQEPRRQLTLARDAVFRSWNNPRARTYRRMHKISESLGTAVNVQMMVFGNLGERSATGVGFTRNPSTGAKEFYGEFLQNAQGEDVVAGIRTPVPVAELEKFLPEAYRQLRRIAQRLERHYRDMQDFEYTVEEGTLYMLQTRTGKRTGRAALKIAYDMVKEKLITPREAVMRVEPAQLEQLLHPIIDDSQPLKVIAKGLPASPGAAVGRVVFTADEAAARGRSEPLILVRAETVPDDIHGMDAAAGILTARGGMTSHAAVVARGMGKCCVAGCETIRIHEAEGLFSVDSHRIKAGDWISLDGTTGRVILGQAKTIKPDPATGEFAEFMKWADRERRLGVRANADIPRDAEVARRFGAEGIGLCRTEHMFFAEERLPHVQAMILADTEASRRQALARLLPMQREDFKGLFREMDGFPVTIRLLDPPLHEFLPKREVLMVEIERLKGSGKTAELAEKERLLERVEQLHEFNPMLGHRGCRLGISYPEISEMQARAIFEAACEVAAEGIKVLPEVMIPLVGHVRELALQKELVVKVAGQVFAEKKRKVEYLVGTMIELPRAAVTADQIACEAQFFSFGTNDLTQTTFGFSRDDTGRIIREYEQLGILDDDPFQVLDAEGVGVLIRMGTELGRRARPNLKVGICGEHGGDPASVEFCHQVGMNYVSCSPYSVPVARLAAAQAAIKEKMGLVEGVSRTA